MDTERVVKLAQHRARTVYQRALDDQIKGDPVEHAALILRYRPIEQYQKEGPDVGQRQEAESKLGRIN